MIRSITASCSRLLQHLACALRPAPSAEALARQRKAVSERALRKGLELIGNTPSDQRLLAALQFGQLFEHVLPGFTECLCEAALQLGLWPYPSLEFAENQAEEISE